MNDHLCEGIDGWGYVCTDGTVYGPCSAYFCPGDCEPVADCSCDCHESAETQSSTENQRTSYVAVFADGPLRGEEIILDGRKTELYVPLPPELRVSDLVVSEAPLYGSQRIAIGVYILTRWIDEFTCEYEFRGVRI